MKISFQPFNIPRNTDNWLLVLEGSEGCKAVKGGNVGVCVKGRGGVGRGGEGRGGGGRGVRRVRGEAQVGQPHLPQLGG